MGHAWEAREILRVVPYTRSIVQYSVHVRHVILAHVGYNWHVAVHVQLASQQEQLVPGKPLLLPSDVIFIACQFCAVYNYILHLCTSTCTQVQSQTVLHYLWCSNGRGLHFSAFSFAPSDPVSQIQSHTLYCIVSVTHLRHIFRLCRWWKAVTVDRILALMM